MAIVDVSIIPVGTGNPSVSEYVAEVQKVLEKKCRSREVSINTNEYNY